MTDPPPPNTFRDFAIFIPPFFNPVTVLTVLTPNVFRLRIGGPGGPMTRTIYTQRRPPWLNVTGGRLADYDITVPFP